MSRLKVFVARHPVPTYFALTFAISWGGLLAVGGLDGMSGTTWQSDPRLPFLVVAMLAGPSIAGLLLTALVSGRAGLRKLLSRLLRWRVEPRWYAVALLTAPVVFITVHSALSFALPDAFAALLDALDVDQIDVIGLSAGTTSALQLALRHPEKVKHLA